MKEYHRLVAEINLDAIGENISNIRTQIEPKTQLLAIVKADAYGHGALEVSRVCLYNGANQRGRFCPPVNDAQGKLSAQCVCV